MLFTRSDFLASLASLTGSADVEERAVGVNFLLEENVSDERRDNFQNNSAHSDLREAANGYFRTFIQGVHRGHIPCTFNAALNGPALLPATLEPTQKIVRLERIDQLMSRDPALDYNRLSDALANKDVPALTAFTDLYRTYPGERPAFVAFKIEVESDLKEADWARRLIDRMGLYHYFPIAAGQTYSFALMEYKVEDVFRQGVPKVGNRPFALATVLECQNNPAFFPVPGGSEYGFTVDFSNHPPALPTVREVLHVRLDYVTSHVVRFGQVSGPASKPDLGVARQRHLAALRTRTGRHDFGV